MVAEQVERLFLGEPIQQHQHADGFSDLAVAEQPAAQAGGILAVCDGVDRHARKRCQHRRTAGGLGIETVEGFA